MKAQVLYGPGDLRYEERPVPEPGEHELLIRVSSVGICGSDVPRILRTGAHIHPLIPGHEFSGVVEDCGYGSDASLRGRRVGVFPLIPCGCCEACRKKSYEMCRHYDYLGSRCDGGFAEYVRVPQWQLMPLPDEISDEAAAMLEPLAVAAHAMRRTEILPEDTVAVTGLGTIGQMLVMLLKDAGVKKIFAVGNKDFQKMTACGTGIPEEDFIDSRRGDAAKRVRELTDGRGCDVCFECVGRNETVKSTLDMAAIAGRVVLVGNPASDMGLERDLYWKILRSQLKLCGTWNSSFGGAGDEGDDWHYVADRISSGRIVPERLITHRFGLEGLPQGLHIMDSKTEDYIKIMLKP